MTAKLVAPNNAHRLSHCCMGPNFLEGQWGLLLKLKEGPGEGVDHAGF